jgi:protein-S-isoprenylcysteine O-methyltransferase Ste14
VPAYAYAILVAGWLLWMTPFALIKRSRNPAKQIDRRARWGVVLAAVASFLLWQGKFWERHPQSWQIALAIFFFALGSLLSWTSTRALGRQWRIDAGLSSDHELIMAGPYRFLRHPIYTSMLCVLLAAGFGVATPLPLFLLAIVVFLIGTEIRVRIEDKLLASQFGDTFQRYQQNVPAYIPFLKYSWRPRQTLP